MSSVGQLLGEAGGQTVLAIRNNSFRASVHAQAATLGFQDNFGFGSAYWYMAGVVSADAKNKDRQ